MSKQFYSPSEAAEYLGLSASTLAKMRSRGDGPVFRKFGGRIRYSIQDLDAWAERHAATSTSQVM